ncbi:helicase [Leptospira gomenensis]|uniref:DNA 5'-3' helicase n=1 Tax=Leptospira gomenensis TaxID=2484974 RepID=A0A5F1YEB7_9LEPT|nr:helicase C-terminal domain-containing protein [Leptospira gomenensis]TGK37478.1 helicase [Leptospira gomenensis]TGK39516.1 helicase [Leptospira gomenensis]TGK43063.1 helicase [Leptospira gomenensis]TGK54327.1 helicase [Leptospira gomenensis]
MSRSQPYFEKLSSLWDDFEPRTGQIQLSQRIEESLFQGKHLIAEAGTGVGKSLAYLIPAALVSIEREEPVIVSTETKSLQQQLLLKDIPMVSKLLGTELRAEVAMGASNYVCKRKMNHVLREGTFGPEMIPHIDSFNRWIKTTESGRKQEFPGTASYDFWNKITREADNCLGRNCPNFSHSYYFLEREKWKRSHILIVNHHLLAAHIASDFNILPEFSRVILDEAHNFPDIIGSSFRQEIRSQEIQKLLQQIWLPNKNTGIAGTISSSELKELTAKAGESLTAFFNALSGEVPLNFYSPQRIKKPLRLDKGAFAEILVRIVDILQKHLARLTKDSEDVSERETSLTLEMLVGRLEEIAVGLESFRRLEDPNLVYWIEPPDQNSKEIYYKICMEPMSPDAIIRDLFAPKMQSIVFTSATLSTSGNDFKYFKKKIGDIPSGNLTVVSPFLYQKNALLYVPKEIRDPVADPDGYHADLAKQILWLIELTQGNTFVLFTSFKSLKAVYEAIRPHTELPLFSQSELGADGAKQMYLETPNSVLFGVSTFWQGIDIRGDKLRSVVIAKLPFQVPNDPVLETKSEKLKESGGNPFSELQLPYACTVLKQGFGRLIRSGTDTGIVSILDPRMFTKNYGKDLLKSLPPAKLVQNREDLRREFADLPK